MAGSSPGSRRGAIAVAVAILVGGLSACSSSASSSSAGQVSASKTVTIGELADLTGTGAQQWGIAAHNGAEIAIDQVNSSGVLGNIKLTLDTQDEATTAANGVTDYAKLVQNGVSLMTLVYSPTLNAIGAQRLQSDGTLFVSPAAGTTVVAPDHVFLINDPTSPINALAGYVGKTKPTSKVGVIYDPSYAAFLAAKTEFNDTYKALTGHDVSTQIALTPNQTDFSSDLTTLRQDGVGAVELLTTGATGGAILRQMQVFGGFNNVIKLGWSAWTSQVYTVAGAAAEGALFPQAWIPGAGQNAATFDQQYQAKFNSGPDVWSAYGHDVVWLIAAAIAANQGKADNGNTLGPLIPAASTSTIFTQHQLIQGLKIGSNGKPSFTSLLATFNSSGTLAPSN